MAELREIGDWLEVRGSERYAVVYPVFDTEPPVYRLRIHVLPERPGWNGGRVLWHRDSLNRHEVLVWAEAWVDREIYP